MNRFEIEELLSGSTTPDEFEGGASNLDENEANEFEVEEGVEMKVYEPKLTRDIMSKYEFVGALTTLAIYLKNKKSLEQYTDVSDIFRITNTAELAFRILQNKKMDITIKRNHGSELVSFSKLRYNPQWVDDLEEYFTKWNASVNEELYKPLAKAVGSMKE